MDLNRCERCGAFFASNDCVCPNCKTKDISDLSKLENFLQENSAPASIEALANDTGISSKNLNRFISENDFSAYGVNLDVLKNTTINL